MTGYLFDGFAFDADDRTLFWGRFCRWRWGWVKFGSVCLPLRFVALRGSAFEVERS